MAAPSSPSQGGRAAALPAGPARRHDNRSASLLLPLTLLLMLLEMPGVLVGVGWTEPDAHCRFCPAAGVAAARGGVYGFSLRDCSGESGAVEELPEGVRPVASAAAAAGA